MHSIDYITLLIYDISSTLYDVTFTMCVTSHNDLISGTKHYMFMIYSLDMATGTVLWPHNHRVPSQPLCLTLHSMYFWPYRQYTNFMKSIECMSSQPLYVWHHLRYIWHHIHYIGHRIDAMSVTKSTLLMILLQIYLWDLILYLCQHHIHCIQHSPSATTRVHALPQKILHVAVKVQHTAAKTPRSQINNKYTHTFTNYDLHKILEGNLGNNFT